MEYRIENIEYRIIRNFPIDLALIISKIDIAG